MATVYLISCVGIKHKKSTPTPARKFYDSSYFEKMREVAEQYSDRWFLLSAKHGLVRPDTVLAPYDLVLKKAERSYKKTWIKNVVGQIQKKISNTDTLIYLGGKEFSDMLDLPLRDVGYTMHTPLKDIGGLGKQLRLLKSWAESKEGPPPSINLSKSTGKPWAREEDLLALGLYLRTPFGKINSHNANITNLSEKISRTVGAVVLKMSNFAALDPTLDRKGMRGYSKLDKEIMKQFSKNPESIIEEISNVMERHSLEDTFNDDHKISSPSTEDSYTLTKTRLSQAYFRRMILMHYDYACAITGMDVPELLVASHIVPWAHRKKTRINLWNGICLNTLHDKAFDRGLLTFDDDYCVILSDSLAAKKYEFFSRYAGKKITLPRKFTPSLEFIRYHREKIFQR